MPTAPLLPQRDRDALHAVEAAAVPLDGGGGLDALVERIAAARTVLVGEASHGTQDFYALRAELTRRLVASSLSRSRRTGPTRFGPTGT